VNRLPGPVTRERLTAAYRRTRYEVLVPETVQASAGPLVLRIDAPSPPLRALYRALAVSHASFLTAWNPHSLIAGETANAAAHARLTQRLAGMGLAWWPGWARDPLEEWPAEQSVFVPGLDAATARHLGAEFEQNAVVHAAADAVPRLIWLT